MVNPARIPEVVVRVDIILIELVHGCADLRCYYIVDTY